MLKLKERQQQGSLLSQARRYGRTKNFVLCENFVRRAYAVLPLSDTQWFNLQVIVGSSRIEAIREDVDASKSLL